SAISNDIGSSDSGSSQLLIIMVFLGLGFGQLIFGPLSDSFGRKPLVFIGFIIFIIASFVCIYATSFEMMIFGRVLQGIGLSAPRTISYSMIRDSFEGNEMARIMSFVTVVFVLVPILAPAMGMFILELYGWQSIFYFKMLFCLIVAVWFYGRQKETLSFENRIPFSAGLFTNGFFELIKYKSSLIYTAISGIVMGSFMLYLSASQQIFQNQYGLVDEFPLIFAGLAVAFGVSTFLNGKLVMFFGMKKLIKISLISFTFSASVYLLLFFAQPNPPIEVLCFFLTLEFVSLGFLFGNLKSISLQPIGHIAGIGAALTGFISTLFAVPISTFLGSFIMDSVYPMFAGFFFCGFFSLFLFFKLNSSNVRFFKIKKS
ncbi:MAG: multidrug effflux MFS transporter, partial [Flavobacteriales bacterium]|nr:multidrug effflux MFS transporter [Flavobacteriales bacterium]